MKFTYLFLFVVLSVIINTGCSSFKKGKSLNDETSQVEPKVYEDGFELLFEGEGSNPKWKVTVSKSEIVYINENFPEAMHFSLIRTTHIMDVAGIGYAGKNEKGEQVIVQVLKEACALDSLSQPLTFSVDVTIANVQGMGKRGCGQFVEDERLKKTWYLESLKGNEIPENNVGTRPNIKMDINKNLLSANMGCNSMVGGYFLMENNLYFNPGFASTKMFCDGVMDLERNFSESITGKTLKYNFKGNRLILTNLNGVEIMTFSGN